MQFPQFLEFTGQEFFQAGLLPLENVADGFFEHLRFF